MKKLLDEQRRLMGLHGYLSELTEAQWDVQGVPPKREYDWARRTLIVVLGSLKDHRPDIFNGVKKMEATYSPYRQMAEFSGQVGGLMGRFSVSVIVKSDRASTWVVDVDAGKIHKEWKTTGASIPKIASQIRELLEQGIAEKK